LASPCAALAFALSAQAQELLPSSFAGWMPGPGARYGAGQMEQVWPGQGALLREYGAVAAERRGFRKEAAGMDVTIMVFRDPTGTFGAFLSRVPGGADPSSLAELAAISDTRALFALANLLVEVEGAGLRARTDDLKALLAAIAPRAKRDAGPFPNLGQYFPAGAISGTRQFALGPLGLERMVASGKGDWLGFALGAEAESARYRLGDRDVTLLLVSYPTPQAAIAREKALRRWFNLNLAEEKVEGRPVLFTRRMSSLLAIATEAGAPKLNEALLAKIHYETQVTLNEPSHLATDPPWGVTLYRIFLGTFYFVGFGIAVGLLFAGFRLAMKRFFPGRVFDRPNSVEIIQLGLGSKPIEGKDFYQ
jgi:hypothetical protein